MNSLSLSNSTSKRSATDGVQQPAPRRQLRPGIREEFHKITASPLLYQLRPEIGPEARLAVVGQYVILFWVDCDVVRIERVVFGGRDLPFLLA